MTLQDLIDALAEDIASGEITPARYPEGLSKLVVDRLTKAIIDEAYARQERPATKDLVPLRGYFLRAVGLSPPAAIVAALDPQSFNTKDFLSAVPHDQQTLIGYLAKYFPRLIDCSTPLQAVKDTSVMSRVLKLRCEKKSVAVGITPSPPEVYRGGIPFLSTFPLSELDTYVREYLLFRGEEGVGGRG